jgi:glycosyltransferase involved in cell wall biosynthesis
MKVAHRENVFLGYHFFPHYRKAIVDCLAKDQVWHFVFAADLRDPTGGVKSMDLESLIAAGQFIRVPCYRLSKMLWQPAQTWAALRSKSHTWILLGFPHNVSVWVTGVLGRLLGKRVLFWGHGWIKPETGARRFVRKTFLGIAHGLLLYGHSAKEIAIRMGAKPESLYVVYNSLDYDLQKSFRDLFTDDERQRRRAALFAHPERPLLVCPSRLTAVRDLPIGFRAMVRLREEGLPCNLLLIGDGPLRNELETMAKQLDLSVHFFGACYDEAELASLISMADVTIAPGQVGLTAIHGLSYGVPVVTHNDGESQMPEYEAIVDGWNGALFARGDVDDFAKAIRRAMSLTPTRAETAARCYEPIDRFYNPNAQAAILDAAIRGLPADSSDWYGFRQQVKPVPCP